MSKRAVGQGLEITEELAFNFFPFVLTEIYIAFIRHCDKWRKTVLILFCFNVLNIIRKASNIAYNVEIPRTLTQIHLKINAHEIPSTYSAYKYQVSWSINRVH